MRHETTQGLYRYWNTIRGGRLAPRRFEIEPAQIVPFLGETLILEVQDENDCRVRVAGTGVGEMLGVDLRRRTFYDLWSDADQSVLRDNIRTIREHGSVGFFTFSGTLSNEGPAALFELLLLPLTHLEDRIDRMLGCISPVHSPEWLETAPPVSLQLLSNELIWPDGRPRAHGSLKRGDLKDVPLFGSREVPILRQHDSIRRARLVRDNRRSFLVYDGGLAQSSDGDESQR